MTKRLMPRNQMRPAPLLTLAMACAIGTFVGAGDCRAQGPQLYRWVDDQGNVNYTDKIPPSEIEKGHTELSEAGTPLRTVPPVKTPEEIERERALARLRQQQQRLIDEQRAEDSVLLRTFRSADDLIMARDGKLTAVDVMIQVTKSNIRRQQDWLERQRAEAARLERAGEPVTDTLKDGIADTERSLSEALAAVLKREQQKQAIRERFARDLERFQELKDGADEAPQAVSAEPRTTVLPNLIECRDERECERMWQAALDYVNAHATTPIETIGTDVAMTKPPMSNQDIALTVTRMRNKDRRGAVIFLDLQCRSFTAGSDNCRTQPRLAVLNGFRLAVESGDAQVAR